jgi:predicted TIM-barrel fold metal-dependent hydrolase
MGARVIDAHCHVASSLFTPPTFIDAVLENARVMRARIGVSIGDSTLREQYVAALQDHQCDRLIADMDAAGIERTVLLLPDFTYRLDCELSIGEMFQRHAAILQRHPGRFEVFAGVDPRWGQQGIDLFDRGVREYGFRGLKLYPPCGYRADDASLFPFYEICAARKLPVLTHMGPTSPALSFATARPEYVDGAALAFPAVSFVLAHAPIAYPEECAALCTFRPNVFLDVSGFQSIESWDPEFSPLRFLLRRGIAHKILFGTDWPVFRAGSLREQLEQFIRVANDEVGTTQLELILAGNALHLLGR